MKYDCWRLLILNYVLSKQVPTKFMGDFDVLMTCDFHQTPLGWD
jgi:hypothetical protein